MKKIYTQPTINTVEFENEDVITTSGIGGALAGDTNITLGDLLGL